ncbi:MAG: TatD family deoxyribonuclease [Solirubrobacterales bacterium]|nr:TatD family deoxyribonuclease [Solirubrobacterales bacterium]
MFDSHTHLDSCAPPNDELVTRARAAGVTGMLTVGTDGPSNRTALAAAETYEDVYAAIGHHPNHATGFGEADLEDLRELARHPRCLAIGETGLDDFRDYAPRPDQERAFRAQIELARELGKPLIIHTRAADEDTLRMLRDHAGGVTVILHCFSMPDRVEECLAQNWWISFAGNVTYPKNADLARAALRVPAGRLLAETDAPYLTPQAVRKHRNEPAFVVHTVRFLAELRDEDPAELAGVLAANARHVLRVP